MLLLINGITNAISRSLRNADGQVAAATKPTNGTTVSINLIDEDY